MGRLVERTRLVRTSRLLLQALSKTVAFEFSRILSIFQGNAHRTNSEEVEHSTTRSPLWAIVGTVLRANIQAEGRPQRSQFAGLMFGSFGLLIRTPSKIAHDSGNLGVRLHSQRAVENTLGTDNPNPVDLDERSLVALNKIRAFVRTLGKIEQ